MSLGKAFTVNIVANDFLTFVFLFVIKLNMFFVFPVCDYSSSEPDKFTRDLSKHISSKSSYEWCVLD
jgi:hypothetical protein